MTFKLQIEQIAFAVQPLNWPKAKSLLSELGVGDWVDDKAIAKGTVRETKALNSASLSFGYAESKIDKMEVELINYELGYNFLSDPTCDGSVAAASHISMHVTPKELVDVGVIMHRQGIKVVQDVTTVSHESEFLRETGRRYRYKIFETRWLLGMDLKFIVRIEPDKSEPLPGEEL